jgi:hypothetical protein
VQSFRRQGELRRQAAGAEAVLRCPLPYGLEQQRLPAVVRCWTAGPAAALLRQYHLRLELCGLPSAQPADCLPRGHWHGRPGAAAWRRRRQCLCGSAWRHAARCCRRCGCRLECAPGRLPVHSLHMNKCCNIRTDILANLRAHVQSCSSDHEQKHGNTAILRSVRGADSSLQQFC